MIIIPFSPEILLNECRMDSIVSRRCIKPIDENWKFIGARINNQKQQIEILMDNDKPQATEFLPMFQQILEHK